MLAVDRIETGWEDDIGSFGDSSQSSSSASETTSGDEANAEDEDELEGGVPMLVNPGQRRGLARAGVTLTLHAPVVHHAIHCPPMTTPVGPHGAGSGCNCVSRFGLPDCLLDHNRQTHQFFAANGLDFDVKLRLARLRYTDPLTAHKGNNLMRKVLYKKVFHIMDWGGVLQPAERRRLPVCVEATIRMIYPSTNGEYMGYREN